MPIRYKFTALQALALGLLCGLPALSAAQQVACDSPLLTVGLLATTGTASGQFDGPNGVVNDVVNSVFYVVDQNNHRVQSFDASGNSLAIYGSLGSGNGQFSSPSSIAVDTSTHFFYVADTSNDRVQVFDASGAFQGQIGVTGVPGFDNSHLSNPVGVAVVPGGYIYVADGNRVIAFDSSYNYVTAVAAPGNAAGNANGEFDGPSGLATDGSYIYVADTNNNRIQIFDVSLTFIEGFGALGSGDGQLNSPMGVGVDALGQIWVADTGNNRVQLFDFDMNYVSKFGGFNTPTQISIDAVGHLWVADRQNEQIDSFDVSGCQPTPTPTITQTPTLTPTETQVPPPSICWQGHQVIGSLGSGDGEFGGALEVQVIDGQLWTIDYPNSRVEVFDLDGNYLFKFGSAGSGDGQFNSPVSLAFDGSHVAVTDFGNNRIQLFDTDGNYVLQAASSSPWGIAYNGGNYFVTARGTGTLDILDSGLNFIGNFPIGGTGNDGYGVYADASNVWVVQGTDGTVLEYDHSGSPINTLSAPGISGPRHLAAGNGMIFLTSYASNQVFGFDYASGALQGAFGVTGGGFGELDGPHGLAFDNGLIYVAESNNFRVQSFEVCGSTPTVSPTVTETGTITQTLPPTALPTVTATQTPGTAPAQVNLATDGDVVALASDPSGNIYFGGNFSYAGQPGGHVLFADPSTAAPMPGWPRAFGGSSTCMVSDGVGGFYVGGNFSGMGGLPLNMLAHVLANGAVDPVFNANIIGTNVTSLTLQGMTLYIGGDLINVGGVNTYRVAAVNCITGAVNSSFAPNFDGPVVALASLSHTVYVSGGFSTVNESPRAGVAGLDPVNGSTTNFDPQPDGAVLAIAALDDQVFLGGTFNNIYGSSASTLASVSLDDGRTVYWSPSPAMPGNVYALCARPARLYAAGDGGARGFDVPTHSNTAFNVSLPGATVNSIVEDFIGGLVYVVGQDSGSAALTQAYDSTTGAPNAWLPDAVFGSYPSGVAFSQGVVGVAGDLKVLAPQARSNLASIDSSGSLRAWNPGADGTVMALASDASLLYVGGNFANLGGQSSPNFGALNFNSNSALAAYAASPDSYVETLLAQGGYVYLGGNFTQIGAQTRYHLAALAAGPSLSAWDPAANAEVLSISGAGGSIFAVGSFGSIGGVTTQGLGKVIDAAGGTGWADSAFVVTHDSNLYSVLADGPSGTLYVGGDFFNIQGQPRNAMAALGLTDASLKPFQLNAPSGVMLSFALDGNVLYASGNFAMVDGNPQRHLLAASVLSGAAQNWKAGTDDQSGPFSSGQYSALLISGGKLYSAGQSLATGSTEIGGMAGYPLAPQPTGVPTLTSSPTQSPTASSTPSMTPPPAGVWDDFELPGHGNSTYNFPAGDPGNGAFISSHGPSTFGANVNSGTAGYQIMFDTGNPPSSGVAMKFGSPYGNWSGQGYRDMSGATSVDLWVKPYSSNLQIKIALDEAGNTNLAVNGGDGEEYYYPGGVSVTTLGPANTWQHLQIPIASFVDNPFYPYTPVSVGNNTLDLQAIHSVNLVILGNQGSELTIAVDDISFGFAPPTPTLTPSPSPSITATPTQSPSATASSSQTSSPTATASPTPSPTVTATMTSSATASATVTITLSPSITATPSLSPSNSPTATATRSFTQTGTVTPTATPTATPTFASCTIVGFAGNGVPGSFGDGGPATAAGISGPAGVALDLQGRLLIADANANNIRRVELDGTMVTIAGTGAAGYNGESQTALTAQLNAPNFVAVDGAGAIYISDTGNHRVRRIDPSTGNIVTVAGTGVSSSAGLAVTGSATAMGLNGPEGLAIDNAGNLYIADAGNNAVRKVSPGGVMSTVAGTGTPGFSGKGVSESAAAGQLNTPMGLAIDAAGNLYIADAFNHAIRMVTSNGIMSTVAGDGSVGSKGDNGPALNAEFSFPGGLAFDGAGVLYVSDASMHNLRKFAPGGNITLVAGVPASPGFNGDGQGALTALLNNPEGILVNAQGDLLVSDTGNRRVRRIISCGVSPFVRPALPACVLGDALAGSRSSAAKKVSRDYLRFEAFAAPNPAMASGTLCLNFPASLSKAHVWLQDISGAKVFEGGDVGGQRVCVPAPAAPGIYFATVEAESVDGDKKRQTIKFAVVKP